MKKLTTLLVIFTALVFWGLGYAMAWQRWEKAIRAVCQKAVTMDGLQNSSEVGL